MYLSSVCLYVPSWFTAMAAELDERILEQLYSWIDSIPLTRPKKDLKRDFSDGGIYLFNYLFDASREVSTELSPFSMKSQVSHKVNHQLMAATSTNLNFTFPR